MFAQSSPVLQSIGDAAYFMCLTAALVPMEALKMSLIPDKTFWTVYSYTTLEKGSNRWPHWYERRDGTISQFGLP